MKLAICIPIWGRDDLTQQVLDYYRDLREEFGFKIIVGLSEMVAFDLSDCYVVFSENAPLSAKFNNIFEAVPRDYEGAMIIGSDNLIHPEYFRWVAGKKPVFSELGRCFYFEQATGEMLLHYRAVLGAGKYLSRKVLMRCDYRPYEENLNRNVDGGPKRFVADGECVHLTGQNWAIDIKTPEENMWSFNHIKRKYKNTENAKAEDVFNTFDLDVNSWLLGGD